MTRQSAQCIAAATFCLAFSISLGRAQNEMPASSTPNQDEILRITKEVRRQIVMLPQYGVFDYIRFAIKGSGAVVLEGKASRPTLKSSAENVVKRIEGVTSVDNQIQVLPLSPNDDRIRAAVYASIYGYPPLQKYTANRGGPRARSVARTAGGITNDPPLGFHAIHIIVENGNVTLRGVVDNDTDLAIAGMRANVVPGVFSVDNDLQVASQAQT
ncbi:MAG TPA: BON domain-containing protein [Terriglobales bacterium]|jgi:osmotically-inducible protein OsmY|nr:BON domain-containing protein [Terriglobales bacterium]